MIKLSEAARKLRDGDFDGALDVLLVAWDETRAPALAELIDAVSLRVTAQLPSLAIVPQVESLTAWVELARQKRASDVGRLLKALIKVLAVGPARLPLPRLQELSSLRPDPRVAPALLAALAGPRKGWSIKSHLPVAKALIRHGDARLSETLTELRSKRSIDDRYDKVIEAWKQLPPAQPAPTEIDEVRAALAEAPAPVTAAPKTQLDGDALLAAIYEDPSDDDRRLVYADFLSGQGDPRGELIVLQLDRAHGRGSDEKLKREEALLKKHRRAWLGPLGAEIVIGKTEWARGFPVAAVTKLAKLYALESSVLRVEWATFERIRFESAHALISDTMRGLEEAYGLSETAMKRLGKLTSLPPRLHTMELNIGYKTSLDADAAPIVAALSVPSLRTLTLRIASGHEPSVEEMRRFCRGVTQTLTSLTLTGYSYAACSVFAPLIDHDGARDADVLANLRRFGWGTNEHLVVTVERDDSGAWSTIEVHRDQPWPHTVQPPFLAKMLGGFGKDRFQLARVTGEGKGAENIAAALALVARRVDK